MNQNYIHKEIPIFWGMLAVVTLVFAFLPLQVMAQTACTVGGAPDSDCDGFHDGLETGGFLLWDESTTLVTDPNTPDVFLIFVPAASTQILFENPGGDPFEFLRRPILNGGPGIELHVINASQASILRQVTAAAAQKAVRLTESLSTTGTELGVAQHGGPNGIDGATVYSQRIINFVTGVYADNGQVPPAGLIDDYIKNVIAHETGHVLSLTKDYNSRFGGNHVKSGAGVLMEQTPKYTVKGSNITFYISESFENIQNICLNVVDADSNCLPRP